MDNRARISGLTARFAVKGCYLGNEFHLIACGCGRGKFTVLDYMGDA